MILVLFKGEVFAGRLSDVIPIRRSAIPAEHFCLMGHSFYKIKKALAKTDRLC